MRVIEIGNLTGIEGLDCGILIEASEEELKRVGDLLYERVELRKENIEPKTRNGFLRFRKPDIGTNNGYEI